MIMALSALVIQVIQEMTENNFHSTNAYIDDFYVQGTVLSCRNILVNKTKSLLFWGLLGGKR